MYAILFLYEKASAALINGTHHWNGVVRSYAGHSLEPRRLSKRRREFAVLAGLFRRLGVAEFNIELRERPDAVVRVGSVTVACELRELHADDKRGKGAELQRFVGEWVQIVTELFATLEVDGCSIPYCVVDFKNTSEIYTKGMRDKFVSELVIAGKKLCHCAELEPSQCEFPTLSKSVARIRVIQQDGEGCLWWPSHLQSGEVAPLHEAASEAIDKKIELAVNYTWPTNVVDRWLILYAAGVGLTDVLVDAHLLSKPPEMNNPFTNILVWDKFSENIWSIHPSFQLLCDGSRQRRNIDAFPYAIRSLVESEPLYPTRWRNT